MISGAQGNLWQATCVENANTSPLDEDLQTELAIVGGGITGCSAALKAAELGVSCCLLEAQDIGHGGSGRNVGLVNAGLWTPPDDIAKITGRDAGERLTAILADAPELVFRLIEQYQIDCEAVRNGTLHCAHSPSGMKDLRNRELQQQKRGAPVKLLDASEARVLTGSQSVHGALLDTRAGTVQPLAYCRGLARAAVEQGARVASNTRVNSISRESNFWRLSCGNRTVRSRYLLLATNAYHGESVGIEPPVVIPVHFFQIASTPLTDQQRARVLPEQHGCWDTALVMSAFRMDRAGRLIVGGIGNTESPFANIHLNWAERKLKQLYPDLGSVTIEHEWCGRIAMTGDHLPRVVQAGPDMISIYGYSGRGIGPGTVFGRAAASSLLSGETIRMPLTPITKHSEFGKGPRAVYYESGALLNHVLSQRI